MFLSSLKEAKAFFNDYLPKTGSYYIFKKNYSFDTENPSVNFVYLNRNYDKEAWKLSKKGFFYFKKHIPELITKL